MLDDIEAKYAEATKPDALTKLLTEDFGLEDPTLVAMWAESDDPDDMRAWLEKTDRAAIFMPPSIEVQPDDQ